MIKNSVYILLALFSIGYGNFAHATLLFSEYVEGSSYNKALELYNNGSAVDFDAGLYSIAIYSNGSGSASHTLTLTGSIAQDSAFVLANSRADTSVQGLADIVSGALNFNGDDAIVLLQGGVIIDRIGQIGVDPGTAWGTGGVTTANATLRRAPDILIGDSLAYDAFDPAAHWAGYAMDDFSDLGRHTIESTSAATTVVAKAVAVPSPNTLSLAGLGLAIVLIIRLKAKHSVTQQEGFA